MSAHGGTGANGTNSTNGGTGLRPGVELQAFQDSTQWAWAAAVTVAAALRRALETGPRVRLLLSGGTTPGPAYAALARAPLAWDRVDVALVDERWLLPDDPDSNARLVRESLLANAAAAARFESITRPGRSIDEAVTAANMHAAHPAAVVVLGMGEDGHVASLFPNMIGLADAIASPRPYVAVDATGCPGAGPWTRRVSLTPAGLAPAQTRLLLIRGAHKRALLDRVLAGDDPMEFPVRLAFTTPGAPLRILWCP
ncbi:6-phosphogluconolactonase [Luteimonas granuli]|uniref:6-phosphogluconolactonase n=1 Tax=Luteimonas granuli TaxID=1176533 RepID=A0A518N707_9GAMM|nr:6-phosphogluconolactonase [Luteimonas granuli]QDW67700.1 6-phosphogluconolactonase [Luteimonas granuli]